MGFRRGGYHLVRTASFARLMHWEGSFGFEPVTDKVRACEHSLLPNALHRTSPSTSMFVRAEPRPLDHEISIVVGKLQYNPALRPAGVWYQHADSCTTTKSEQSSRKLLALTRSPALQLELACAHVLAYNLLPPLLQPDARKYSRSFKRLACVPVRIQLLM